MGYRKGDKNFHVEALDRCESVNQIISVLLLKHCLIKATPKWKKKIEKAQQLIAEVYQEIGEKAFD